MNISLRGGKKYIQILNAGITCLWDSGATNRMINCKHINPYKSKKSPNKFKYSTAAIPYKMTHDMKVPFIMPEFSRRKIITHRFHVDKFQGDEGISYYLIIGHDLMIKLGLKADFGHQILEWDDTVVPMKDSEKI